MLVVVATRHDDAARSLVERWAPHGAVLLTPADLSHAGWCHYVPGEDRSTAVLDGSVVASSDITGVLVRWPGVLEDELTQIVRSERPYVAREMVAFLASWLACLPCPVLNRPSPTNLMGPDWSAFHWMLRARELGIPTARLERTVSLEGGDRCVSTPTAPSEVVTVIGDRCLGAPTEATAKAARRLASDAGVDLLVAHFSATEPDTPLMAADYWADITSEEVAEALLEYFSEGGSEHGRRRL